MLCTSRPTVRNGSADETGSGLIRIAGILRDSVVDGPGLRTTIFAQGCPHHCPGCHNPETWPFAGGTLQTEDALFAYVCGDPLSKAVTFSGGEPFAQAEGFFRLARRLRQAGYETASYTGYTFEQLLSGEKMDPTQHTDCLRFLGELDILVDGPFLLEERTLELPFRGSRNQRILNVPESLRQGCAVTEASDRWNGEY